MTNDLKALTDEVRAVNGQLRIVAQRLEDAEKRASRQSSHTRWLAAALALSVVLNGAFFVYAMNERDRMCAAMRDGFDVYTDALVATGDRAERTEAEQAERDEQERSFRADVERRLAACG
jgi:hypothetical protein